MMADAANALKITEESFSLTSTWIINPFASVLRQPGSNHLFQSPVFQTRWNDQWQITLQLLRKITEAQPVPYLLIDDSSFNVMHFQGFEGAEVLHPRQYMVESNPYEFELKTTLANLNGACCFKGRRKFCISAFFDKEPINTQDSNIKSKFTVLNGCMLSSTCFIGCHQSWLSKEELELCVKIEFCPDLSSEFNFMGFDVHERFASIKEVKELHDVTILIGGQELKANKTVLALTSPVFLAMFTNDFQEKREQRICIKDTDVRTMEKFLDFAYTGQNPNFVNVESAVKLFHVAEKYQVSVLKQMCMRYLRASTENEETFMEMLLSFQPA